MPFQGLGIFNSPYMASLWSRIQGRWKICPCLHIALLETKSWGSWFQLVFSGKALVFFIFFVKAKAFLAKLCRDRFPRKQKEGMYMKATGSTDSLIYFLSIHLFLHSIWKLFCCVLALIPQSEWCIKQALPFPELTVSKREWKITFQYHLFMMMESQSALGVRSGGLWQFIYSTIIDVASIVLEQRMKQSRV